MAIDPKQDLLQQIAQAEADGNLYQKELCERWLARLSETPEQITEQNIINTKKSVAAKSPEEVIYSFLPHELCKVPIFFPMSDKELKKDRRLLHTITTETSWGSAEIRGLKLSIFEEDVLLALIRLAKDGFLTTNKELILKSTIFKIAFFIYGKNAYTKRVYDSILTALKNFGLVTFTLSIYSKTKNDFKKEVSRVISMSAIVPHFDYLKKSGEITIKFNHEFFSFLSDSSLTNINFTLRRKLKKAGSKAMLRFLSTHSNLVKMNFLTILKAINFNVNQPTFTLRHYFKGCLKELIRVGILGPKTKMYADDMVFLDVKTSVLKPRKLSSKEVLG